MAERVAQFLTVSAAARELAVARRTVLRWIHTGRLVFTRFPDEAGQYRVPLAAIEKMKATRRSIW